MIPPGNNAAPDLEAPHGAAPILDAWLGADGRLAADVSCLRCGYNLRSLRPDSTCPECGAPVKFSFGPERLLFADRAWLQGLIRGFDLVFLGAALLPVMGAIALVFAYHALLQGGAVLGSFNTQSPPPAPLAALMWMVVTSPSLLIAWGVWKVTEPEPRTGEPDRWHARRAARWAGLLACVLFLLAVPIFAAGGQTVEEVAYGLGCLALTVFGFATLFRGRWLARRMGSTALAGWTVALAVSYALLAAGVGIGFGLVFFIGNPPPARAPFAARLVDLAMMGFCFWTLLAGATGVATVFVGVGFRASLARQVRLALMRSAAYGEATG